MRSYRNMHSSKSNLLVAWLLIISVNQLVAQEANWKTKTIKKEKIEIKYCISEIENEKGDKVLKIQDTSTAIVYNTNMDKCIEFIRVVANHKQISGYDTVKVVKAISQNEWIVFYYSNNPWPIQNSDCVARMTLTKNELDRSATFTLKAATNEYPIGSVNRMTAFEVVYHFKELANGIVKITVTGSTSPPVNIPKWMVKSAFPKVPLESIREIKKNLVEPAMFEAKSIHSRSFSTLLHYFKFRFKDRFIDLIFT
jgi:hypothetical protein